MSRLIDLLWLGKRWETDDDRAIRVRVFMPDVLAPSERDIGAGVLSAAEYRELKGEIIKRMPASSRQLRWLSRFFIALLGVLLIIQIINGPWNLRTILVDLLLIRALPLVMFVLTLRGVGDSPATVREVFIERRRCPSCGFDLSGQPVAADGCTLCPECNAAWRC